MHRPAGHRHELFLPAPRGRRQLAELHLRHRRHHRPGAHPRRHALGPSSRPVHRRLAIVPLVKPWFSEARRNRSGVHRSGAPADPRWTACGPDAAHAAVATASPACPSTAIWACTRPICATASRPSRRRARSHGLGALLSLLGGWATATTTQVLFSLLISPWPAACCSPSSAIPWRARRCHLSRRGHQRHGHANLSAGIIKSVAASRAGFGLWQALIPLSRATCSAI